MKIKKFKARNFAEALEQVKREFSGDAVILSTEEKKGIRPCVEVTAAVDYDSRGFQRTVISPNCRGVTPVTGAGFYCNAPRQGSSLRSEVSALNPADEIRGEIERLREAIEGMRNNGYEMALPAKKRMILHFLKERAVREEFALRICEKARDLNDIPSVISADIKVRGKALSGEDHGMPQNPSGCRVVMLIGPTGVGKTTTIAKLSAIAIREGKRVAIINLDTYRIGAIEQVRIYSRIMGIPLFNASNAVDLKDCLLSFAESRDIVFIDTTGRNPRDEAYINDLLEIWGGEGLSAVPLREIHLLMSASSDDEFMIEAYRFYRRLPIDCIAFTKVDEAVRFGSMYNLMLTYQRPVAYITTGQRVPGDIEFVSSDRLIELIFKKECCKC